MRPRIDLPIGELAARYRAGESTRVLGRAYDVDSETIRRRLHAAGMKMRPRGEAGGGQLGNKNRRTRGGPLHADGKGYLRTYDRGGRPCSIHRGCWAACNGPIPEGHDVHHVDGEQLNNDIGNLACMTHAQHTGMHNEHAE